MLPADPFPCHRERLIWLETQGLQLPAACMVSIRLEDDTSNEAIHSHIQELKSLPQRIDCTLGLKTGENFADRASGFAST